MGVDVFFAAIPSGFDVGEILFDMVGKVVDGLRVVVAAHKSEAGKVAVIHLNETFQSMDIKNFPFVLPKPRRMTTATMIGTKGKIYSQRNFVRDFLKDNIVIEIF